MTKNRTTKPKKSKTRTKTKTKGKTKAKGPKRHPVAYCVCIVSAYPLIQLLRDALRSLPIRRDLRLNELVSSAQFAFLTSLTRPMSAVLSSSLGLGNLSSMSMGLSTSMGSSMGGMGSSAMGSDFGSMGLSPRNASSGGSSGGGVPVDIFGVKHSPLKVPAHDFSFGLLFRCLHPQRVVRALECLLMERKILLVASELTMLTLAAECLRSLLYPFSWNYLYVPILPFSLFASLQCPTPFLMGVHACYKAKAIELADDPEILVVDLDLDDVYHPRYPSSSASSSTTADNEVPRLPDFCRRQLLATIQRLFFPSVFDLDQPASYTYLSAPFDPSLFHAPFAALSHVKFFREQRKRNRQIAQQAAHSHTNPPPLHNPFALANLRSFPIRDPGMALRLELLKMWTHLLSGYLPDRDEPLSPPSPGSMLEALEPEVEEEPTLIFDSPSFVLSKVDQVHTLSHRNPNNNGNGSNNDFKSNFHGYDIFLSALVKTSFLPNFLHERTRPSGLSPDLRDAFDFYEWHLLGARSDDVRGWDVNTVLSFEQLKQIVEQQTQSFA